MVRHFQRVKLHGSVAWWESGTEKGANLRRGRSPISCVAKMRNGMNSHYHPVAIGSCPQPHEAHLVQLKLGSEGVESSLDGEYTIAVNPLLSNVTGGVRILVSESDAEKASGILQDYCREKAEADAKKARICPECQSDNGVAVHRPLILSVVAVLTLGLLFCFVCPWRKYRCPECGCRWR